MLPPEITRLRNERNTAGGCLIKLLPVEGVAVMPAEVNGAIPEATPIVLAAGYDWTTITPTRATQAFAEDWRREKGARVARASLAFIIPKDRVDLSDPLWELGRIRCLVQHQDENGTVKLMGTKEEPALVTVTNLQHGAGPGQGQNQYLLEASCTRRKKCPFYLAVSTPIPLPPGCPTMGQQIAAALPADILAAFNGEQLEYFTDYFSTAGACPTLAELMADSTIAQIITALSAPQQAAILLLIGEYADYLMDPLTATTLVLVDPL